MPAITLSNSRDGRVQSACGRLTLSASPWYKNAAFREYFDAPLQRGVALAVQLQHCCDKIVKPGPPSPVLLATHAL